MIVQVIILFILTCISPFFPPAVTPFSYPLIVILLLQKINPRFLSIVAICANVLGSLIIRWFRPIVIRRVNNYQTKNQNKDVFSIIGNRIAWYIKKNEKISKNGKRLEEYMEEKWGGVGLFIFSAFMFWCALPDIVIIKIIRKKVNFFFFMTAAIVGKAGAYIPLIFIGKSILKVVMANLWF